MNAKRWPAWSALAAVLIAVICKLLMWWITNDKSTFGPKGSGTEFIRDAFGKEANALTVFLNLQAAVQVMVLLAVGLLCSAILARVEQPKRQVMEPRQEDWNPFA